VSKRSQREQADSHSRNATDDEQHERASARAARTASPDAAPAGHVPKVGFPCEVEDIPDQRNGANAASSATLPRSAILCA